MAVTSKDAILTWGSPGFANHYAPAEVVTGPPAQDLLDRTVLPDVNNDEKLVILDLACGTGVVAAKLLDTLSQLEESSSKKTPNLSLTCSDVVDPMITAVTQRIEACGWPNTKAVKANAMDTKLPSAEYTHVLMNFGPFVLPNWRAGLQEMHRVLRPGGKLGLSSWKKLGWLADVHAAFASDPELPPISIDPGLRGLMSPDGCWDDEEWVREMVQQAGFDDVVAEPIPYTIALSSVDTFLAMIAGMVGLATSKSWTKEQQDKYAHRAAAVVEKFMRGKYADGEIIWDWVAVLATAKKPA